MEVEEPTQRLLHFPSISIRPCLCQIVLKKKDDRSTINGNNLRKKVKTHPYVGFFFFNFSKVLTEVKVNIMTSKINYPFLSLVFILVQRIQLVNYYANLSCSLSLKTRKKRNPLLRGCSTKRPGSMLSYVFHNS